MKVTTERLENCQVNVIIEMDAADIEKKLRQTARSMSRQYTIPGYRRGKAPYHAVIRVFGREMVQQQALEDFGNDLYEAALEEIEYDPYEVGELQEVEWDPFRMTILLPIRPEVDLGDYRAVRVPFEPEAITDERVEEYLTELRQDKAQWVPVERPAGLGDMVVIDAEGKIEDDVVLSNEDHELILEGESNIPLPGFHAEIVGMSPGEDKTFALTYPEDDPREEVAGKEATFTVRLYTVKGQDLPPLDDELAMMVGDYDSLDALKAAIRENLETEALQAAEAEYLDNILETMIEEAVKIEYPLQAVDREADLILDQMERNLASTGLELDNYLAMIGKTREMYKREVQPSAEARLQKRMVLNQVARREDLQVDSEEIDAEIDRLSAMLGDEADQMRQVLDTPEGRQSMADDLVIYQVQERVKQIAKGEAPPLKEATAEAEVETQSTAEDEETETEAQPGVETQAEAEVEVGPETEVEAESGTEGEEAEIEGQAEAEPQAEVAAEPGESKASREEPAPDAPAGGEEPEAGELD
jgi:trigger factor